MAHHLRNCTVHGRLIRIIVPINWDAQQENKHVFIRLPGIFVVPEQISRSSFA